MASVLDLIGDTPLVELTRIDTGPCRLFLKLESPNPRGSIKDRMARVDDRGGRERTAGSSPAAPSSRPPPATPASAWRRSAAARATASCWSCPTRWRARRSCTARPWAPKCCITRSDVGKGHPEYYQDMAEAIAERTPGAFYINQFANPANPLAHETTTGPEICGRWRATSTPSWSASARAARSPASAASCARPRRRPRWCWPIRRARSSRRLSRPARWSRPAAGRSKASARISSRPTATCRWCSKAYSIPDRESLLPRASCCARKAFWRARRPARCSPRRCAIAASRPSPSGSSPSSATPAPSISPRSSIDFLAQEGWTEPERHGDLRDS